jgi:hypothetical protein
LTGAEVPLFCDEGHETGVAKTGQVGNVSFDDKQVEDGLDGIMAGHTVKDQKGELDGKAYTAASYYPMVTFIDPQTTARQQQRVRSLDLGRRFRNQ